MNDWIEIVTMVFMGLLALLVLAIPFGAVYVILHFIMKFW